MIEEINGRWTCTKCGYQWSAMLGDNEIPDNCSCMEENENEDEDEEEEFCLTVTLNVGVMAESYEDAVDWLRSNIYSNPRQYDFNVE